MGRIDRALLPSLTLAYPATLVVVEVRPQCRPGCPPFGAVDVAAALVAGVGALVIGAAAAGAVERARASSHPLVDHALSPAYETAVALVLVYVGFLGFLFVDALEFADGPWRLVPVVASLPLFAPAWTIYVGTFVLAALLPVLGVSPSPGLTTAVRAVLVVVGFGGSAAWQFAIVEGVVGSERRADPHTDGTAR